MIATKSHPTHPRDTKTALDPSRRSFWQPAAARLRECDTFEGVATDPISLHKYLYTHGDPVNFVDPSGLFTEAFGYAAERAIWSDHRLAFPFPQFDVLYGQQANLPGAMLIRPDILNLTNQTYNEIKPLSPSGIIKGAAQMIAREIQLGPLGYEPDIDWPQSPRMVWVGVEPILYFNLEGVIFYTSSTDLAEDVLGLSALGYAGAAWKLLQASGNALLTALERIPQLVTSGRAADNGRFEGGMSIGALLAGMGFV